MSDELVTNNFTAALALVDDLLTINENVTVCAEWLTVAARTATGRETLRRCPADIAHDLESDIPSVRDAALHECAEAARTVLRLLPQYRA